MSLSIDLPSPRSLLPHREPFLFLDSIVELSADHIVARKTFQASEPFFAGHFPGNPIVPGVILIETMAQAMACCATPGSRGKMLLVAVDHARFRDVVGPGDNLEVRVQVLRRRLAIVVGEAEILRDGQVVAEAQISGLARER